MMLTRTQKLGIAGGCMFTFSIFLKTLIVPSLIKSEVKKNIALESGSRMREIWGKFPFSMELNFYFFNVTNPDGITKGEKPILQEVGPWVYEEWQEKTDQLDHDEDDTISYFQRSSFYFNAERSNGYTGNEVVTVPNYFVYGMVTTVERKKPHTLPIVAKAVDAIFKNPDTLFMQAKVKDILFDGMLINCDISMAQDFSGSAVCAEIRKNYKTFHLDMVKDNVYSFSLWGSRNGTSNRRLRVKRGMKDLMDVGKVVRFDNKPKIGVWGDEYCDTFNGTDGTIFHPFYNKKGKDDIVAYSPDMCRSISCHFHSKTKYAGMKLLRYTADIGIDPENNPLHKCYCSKKNECVKKGAFDLDKCVGLPIILTSPHFYNADPYYLSTVTGLRPDQNKHMIIIDFDPFTGSPIHVHERIQFNFFISKNDQVRQMNNLPDALLPLFWVDQKVILPDYLLEEIKMAHAAKSFAKLFTWALFYFGLILCGLAGFRIFKKLEAENKLLAKPAQSKNNGRPGTGDGKVRVEVSPQENAPEEIAENQTSISAETQTSAAPHRTGMNVSTHNEIPVNNVNHKLMPNDNTKNNVPTDFRGKPNIPLVANNQKKPLMAINTLSTDVDALRPASVPPNIG